MSSPPPYYAGNTAVGQLSKQTKGFSSRSSFHFLLEYSLFGLFLSHTCDPLTPVASAHFLPPASYSGEREEGGGNKQETFYIIYIVYVCGNRYHYRLTQNIWNSFSYFRHNGNSPILFFTLISSIFIIKHYLSLHELVVFNSQFWMWFYTDF